ncbi:hypothetical protein BH23ACT10_BH23ACT10_39820 [soil metagenome]
MTSEQIAHRILLVREWDSQTSGSGCCGRIGGEHCDIGHPDTFAHSRSLMEVMGAIYRALRRELPRTTVDITVVDPRNMVWLIPTVLRDGRRRGMGPGELWRQLTAGTRNGAIVVDGRALYAHDYADEDAAVTAVLHELAASPT